MSRRDRCKRFVIVGAGSSAIGLAVQLSRVPNVELVILEQGSVAWPLDSTVQNAERWPAAATDNRTKYALSMPQEQLFGRQVRLPLGSGIGGSSNVNAMIFGLGHRRVFDERWPQQFRSNTMEK